MMSDALVWRMKTVTAPVFTPLSRTMRASSSVISLVPLPGVRAVNDPVCAFMECAGTPRASLLCLQLLELRLGSLGLALERRGDLSDPRFQVRVLRRRDGFLGDRRVLFGL